MSNALDIIVSLVSVLCPVIVELITHNTKFRKIQDINGYKDNTDRLIFTRIRNVFFTIQIIILIFTVSWIILAAKGWFYRTLRTSNYYVHKHLVYISEIVIISEMILCIIMFVAKLLSIKDVKTLNNYYKRCYVKVKNEMTTRNDKPWFIIKSFRSLLFAIIPIVVYSLILEIIRAQNPLLFNNYHAMKGMNLFIKYVFKNPLVLFIILFFTIATYYLYNYFKLRLFHPVERIIIKTTDTIINVDVSDYKTVPDGIEYSSFISRSTYFVPNSEIKSIKYEYSKYAIKDFIKK